MGFKKGNISGRHFGADHQPSPEAKRRGKAKAKLMRETMKELLLAIEPDDQAAAAVMTYFPKKKRNKVTTQDTICLRQLLEAKKGSTRAYNNILKSVGESIETLQLGMADEEMASGIKIEIIDKREDVKNEDTDNADI